MNHDVFEIARRLLPGYYHEMTSGKKKDDPTLEKLPKFVPIDSETSYLS